MSATPIQGVLVSTSDACAVGCRFCFRADVGRDVLTIDQYSRALSRLHEFGAREVCLSGGEPTDHPSFHQLVRIALQYGYRCAVVTAARSEPRVAALARAARMLSHVTVSADSENAERLGRTGRTIASARATLDALGHERASLHVTMHEPTPADIAAIRQALAGTNVPVEISPLLPSPTFRFDAPDLQRDIVLIEEAFALSPALETTLNNYRDGDSFCGRDCESTRWYLSADGYLRRCPYEHAGQVHISSTRAQLRDAIEAMTSKPPHTQLACGAICKASTDAA